MGALQFEVAFTNPGPLGAGPSHLERKHRARFRGLIVNGLSAMLTDMLKSVAHAVVAGGDPCVRTNEGVVSVVDAKDVDGGALQ